MESNTVAFFLRDVKTNPTISFKDQLLVVDGVQNLSLRQQIDLLQKLGTNPPTILILGGDYELIQNHRVSSFESIRTVDPDTIVPYSMVGRCVVRPVVSLDARCISLRLLRGITYERHSRMTS